MYEGGSPRQGEPALDPAWPWTRLGPGLGLTPGRRGACLAPRVAPGPACPSPTESPLTTLPIPGLPGSSAAPPVPGGAGEPAVMLALLVAPAALLYAFLGNGTLAFALAVAALPLLALLRGAGPAVIRPPHGLRRALSGSAGLWLAAVVAAVLMTTLGGEGRLLPATPDWLVRDAVLRDLVEQRWPFAYRTGGADWVLRAPLGMYLLPALAGKLAGLRAAHRALWAQNSLALAAVLRVFCASGSIRRGLVVLVVFCLFGGWDMVGTLAVAARHALGEGAALVIPDDIQWWDRLFQYSSTLTLVLWVPHHALAGWFLAALVLLRERRRIRVGTLMAGAALSIVWSPFALMGAAPFLLWAGIEALRAREVRPLDLAAPALLALALLPLALYLASDSGDVPRGFQPRSTEFLIRYPAFLALEVLPFVVANALFGGGRAEAPRRATYRIAVASLVLIPCYRIGVSNDFVMRASVPALAILAIATGHTAADVLARGGRTGRALLGLVLALGGITGLEEVGHTLATPNRGASTCDFVQAWDQSPYSRYMSDAIYLARRERVPALLRAARPQVLDTGPSEGPCVERRM